MTHHSNHPGHQLTPLPLHPKPPHHKPNNPANVKIPNSQALPTRSSVSGGFIPGRSVHVPIDNNRTLLAGHLGHLGVQLRSATHTGSSESTRAHLHAQAVLAEMQQEMAGIGGRSGRSGRLPMLHKQLNQDVEIFEGHLTAAIEGHLTGGPASSVFSRH